jgi:hypothetical protein
MGLSLRTRTFVPALVFGVVAFGGALLLGLVSRTFGGTSWIPIVGLFLVVQAAVLLRWGSRFALLGALRSPQVDASAPATTPSRGAAAA